METKEKMLKYIVFACFFAALGNASKALRTEVPTNQPTLREYTPDPLPGMYCRFNWTNTFCRGPWKLLGDGVYGHQCATTVGPSCQQCYIHDPEGGSTEPRNFVIGGCLKHKCGALHINVGGLCGDKCKCAGHKNRNAGEKCCIQCKPACANDLSCVQQRNGLSVCM